MYKALLVLLLFLLPSSALAESFADALLAEGDYYRAVTEYKRILHQAPGREAEAAAALGVARGYVGAGRWDEAYRALQEVQDRYPGTEQAYLAKLMEAGAAWRQEAFTLAQDRYQALFREVSDPPQERLRYALGWSRLELNRFEEAAEAFAQNPAPGPELARAALEFKELPRKSPRLAGLMSAVLPGSGQLYAGRGRSAFLAFSLNTAFILGAIEAFENDTPVVGGILVFFELGWYGGNIYNAANSAHKFNRDQRRQRRAELRREFGLELLLGDDQVGLALRGAF